MKTKLRLYLAAIALIVSAFFMPLYAEAKVEEDRIPPTVKAWLENGKINIEAEDEGVGIDALFINGKKINAGADQRAEAPLTDYVGTRVKTIRIYAVDGAGNQSKTVEIENPTYLPDANEGVEETEKSASASMDREQEAETAAVNPMTPDGQAAVLDNATEEEGKEFYTFETANGNIFYLVVDKERDSDNVYFLNQVTEEDLRSLTEPVKEQAQESVIPEEPVCECRDKCRIGGIDTSCKVCLMDITSCKGKETAAAGEDEREQKKEKEGGGGLFFILIAVLAVGGAGYYLKVYKPKHELDDAEDLDDLLEDEEEINEDSPDGDEKPDWDEEAANEFYDDYPGEE